MIFLIHYQIDDVSDDFSNHRFLKNVPSRYIPSLLEQTKKAETNPEGMPALERSEKIDDNIMTLFQILLNICARRAQIAPSLIASSHDLRQLIAKENMPDIPASSGWRWDVFGKEAMRLKKGEIQVTFQKGKLDFVPL